MAPTNNQYDYDILFVDDDKEILSMVEIYLSRQGYRITVVDSGLEALELIKEKDFQIVFTDFKMPEFDGLELLSAIKEYRPSTEVIIVTGYGTMESAIKAMRYGSYDYIQKPFKLDHLKLVITRIMEEKKLQDANIRLRKRLKERPRYGNVVGISLKMQVIYETIDRMAGNTPNVLIHGESGSGKELVGQVIHDGSPRGDKRFVSVNCGSFAKGLSGQALQKHITELIDMAQEGTIYLDEIIEIKPDIQAMLLELIGQGTDAKKGAKQASRVIGSTNKDVDEALEKELLNKEFYQCINEVSITIPPLRERKEDISLLINHFLYRFNAESPKKVTSVSPDAMDLLLGYHWPGNVIQLENVIERAFALGVDGALEITDLPPEIQTFGKALKEKSQPSK